MSARNEIAVLVRRQQWNVVEVLVRQIDAKQVTCLGFHNCPRRHAPDLGADVAVGRNLVVRQQFAGGRRCRPHPKWSACAARVERLHLISTQEYLMRGMRGVGLVLIDKWSGSVLLLVNIVRGSEYTIWPGPHGCTRLDHEAELRR